MALVKQVVDEVGEELGDCLYELVNTMHHASTNISILEDMVKKNKLWDLYSDSYYESREKRLFYRTKNKTPVIYSKENLLTVLTGDFRELAYDLEEYKNDINEYLGKLHSENESINYVDVVRALRAKKNKYGLLTDFLYYCFSEKYKEDANE